MLITSSFECLVESGMKRSVGSEGSVGLRLCHKIVLRPTVSDSALGMNYIVCSCQTIQFYQHILSNVIVKTYNYYFLVDGIWVENRSSVSHGED